MINNQIIDNILKILFSTTAWNLLKYVNFFVDYDEKKLIEKNYENSSKMDLKEDD
jgi:hypothetical protein